MIFLLELTVMLVCLHIYRYIYKDILFFFYFFFFVVVLSFSFYFLLLNPKWKRIEIIITETALDFPLRVDCNAGKR